MTTRSVIFGSSRLVSAKWPRWLVPVCISKPSLVRDSGTAMTPALLISTSIWPSNPSAKACTEDRSARSSFCTSVSPAIAPAAVLPFEVSRTASTTRAPAPASSRAATSPMPLFAPVTTMVRSLWEGRSAAVHLWLME